MFVFFCLRPTLILCVLRVSRTLAERDTALQYDGPGGGCVSGTGTCNWAPQLHNGLIYLSDLNTGLWVFMVTTSN